VAREDGIEKNRATGRLNRARAQKNQQDPRMEHQYGVVTEFSSSSGVERHPGSAPPSPITYAPVRTAADPELPVDSSKAGGRSPSFQGRAGALIKGSTNSPNCSTFVRLFRELGKRLDFGDPQHGAAGEVRVYNFIHANLGVGQLFDGFVFVTHAIVIAPLPDCSGRSGRVFASRGNISRRWQIARAASDTRRQSHPDPFHIH
jgi:hypothetical protein